MLKTGGWLMLPIVFCSIVATAIILERLWVLRYTKVAPRDLFSKIWSDFKAGKLNGENLEEIRQATPLGDVLSSGLLSAKYGREVMKETILEAGERVMHELEKYLSTLGTIAAIAPLLGLLGTVIGMIDVFTVIMLKGGGNSAILAGGISKALITTAAGLSVAIPAVAFHRFFNRRIEELAIIVEHQALRLVETVHQDLSLEQEKVRGNTP